MLVLFVIESVILFVVFCGCELMIVVRMSIDFIVAFAFVLSVWFGSRVCVVVCFCVVIVVLDLCLVLFVLDVNIMMLFVLWNLLMLFFLLFVLFLVL